LILWVILEIGWVWLPNVHDETEVCEKGRDALLALPFLARHRTRTGEHSVKAYKLPRHLRDPLRMLGQIR
jgi:hypothetical protein